VPIVNATKITGKAEVGFVKDNKFSPSKQKVKAITASVPAITFSSASSNSATTNLSTISAHKPPSNCVTGNAKVRQLY